MTVFTMKTLGVAAAFCSTVALAYVVYEKKKRHLNNEKIERESQEPSNKYGSLGIPDFIDKYSIQKYFIDEIQLGEELLNEGKDQEAVSHFIKAIVVCTQRDKFLPVIKNKISKQAYVLLLEGLAEVNVCCDLSAEDLLPAVVECINEVLLYHLKSMECRESLLGDGCFLCQAVNFDRRFPV